MGSVIPSSEMGNVSYTMPLLQWLKWLAVINLPFLEYLISIFD